MHDGITAKVEDGKVIVECADDYNLGNFHGLGFKRVRYALLIE